MVKTRWRWVHCINLKDIAVDLSFGILSAAGGGKTWVAAERNERGYRNGDSHTWRP